MPFRFPKRNFLKAHKCLAWDIKSSLHLHFLTFDILVVLAALATSVRYFLKFLSLFHSSFNFFEFQVHAFFSMAPLSFLQIEKIISKVTPTSLWKTFYRSFLSMKTHYIRAPHLNGQIALFSWPPPRDLVDAHT